LSDYLTPEEEIGGVVGACAPAGTQPAAPSGAPTAAAPATERPTRAPASSPSPQVTEIPTTEPTAPAATVPATPSEAASPSPVEFVWSITGDPNPLDFPADLAVDLQDNLYVVDAGNSRIQVFDPDGNFVRMWGEPGDGEGEFNFLRANGDTLWFSPGTATVKCQP
jgi:hypothetical protein